MVIVHNCFNFLKIKPRKFMPLKELSDGMNFFFGLFDSSLKNPIRAMKNCTFKYFFNIFII